MTVLVTGATSNVGSQTVELLLAAGVPVRAGSLTDDVLAATHRDPVSFREFAAREAGSWAP